MVTCQRGSHIYADSSLLLFFLLTREYYRLLLKTGDGEGVRARAAQAPTRFINYPNSSFSRNRIKWREMGKYIFKHNAMRLALLSLVLSGFVSSWNPRYFRGNFRET